MANFPFPDIQGHRTLAAIVFTDGVSFSARMSRDEDLTLQLLQRDFDLMKGLCRKYEGQVIKSTGDGLLMYFCSAVQAVGCAQEIQKQIAAAAVSLKPEERFEHRIGIHLGDVFLMNDDVMGDGVNIAARLQAEAEPGGICISQTVYDVVKNRLSLKVTYLGPRDLKNIREAVPIYQILLAAQTELQTPEKLTDVPLLAEHHQAVTNGSGVSSRGASVTASSTPTLIEAAMATRAELQSFLSHVLGPASNAVLAEVLQQASSFEELMELILARLPRQKHAEFRTKVEVIKTQIGVLPPEPSKAPFAAPQPAPRSLCLPPQQKQGLETLLNEIAGPIGVVLLRQMMGTAKSPEHLIQKLANQIPQDIRSAFRVNAQQILTSSLASVTPQMPPSAPPAASPPPNSSLLTQPDSVGTDPASQAPIPEPTVLASSAPTLDKAFIQRCRDVLLMLIGPIAPVLLEKALARQPQSPKQLVAELTRQIPDPNTAQEFRRTVEQR